MVSGCSKYNKKHLFLKKRSLKTQKREFLPLSQTQKHVPLPTSQINYSYPELAYNTADSLKHLMKKVTNHMFRLNGKEGDTTALLSKPSLYLDVLTECWKGEEWLMEGRYFGSFWSQVS